MQYKIGRLLGNKPKEAAFMAIENKLQNGDTVVLNSDIIDSVTINAAITLDGQGHTFHVEDETVGINLHNHCQIVNCNFDIGEKANGISVRETGIELSLQDCTLLHHSGDNVYESLFMKSPLHKLMVDNAKIDYCTLNTKQIEGSTLYLGHSDLPRFNLGFRENNKWSATEINVANLYAVNINAAIYGKIQTLNALDVSLFTYGRQITIANFTMDLGLDPEQAITDKQIYGLKIFGNTTLKNIFSPEADQELLDRYGKVAQLFIINPKDKGTIVNISGDWRIVNNWLNQIWNGNVNFINYKDVNQWRFKSEESKITWKNSNFRYKKDYTPKPKQKSAQEKLDEMIGLEDVKKKVKAYIATSIVNKKRKELGQNVAANSLHLIFSGAAGTGKTQVARLLAQILSDNGIIKKSELKEVTAKDMVAEYLGQTSLKTHKLILSAKGGVLFIDEAYELDPTSESDGYKKEAITTLVKDMDDYRSDLIVIMAGYTTEMEHLLQANSGLPSRFVNKIEFPDYSEQELIEISNLQLKQQKQRLDDEGLHELGTFISQAKQAEKVDGNGRWVRNVLQFIGQARDLRIVADGSVDSNPEALNMITAADVREGIANFK
ncbi:hypothetical protein BSQ39_04175 [Loigolactobacillus backii]|uniref:AAA family ATPase n=1 Tax=Loigolactobacillus backii TaxID=375175 RepID=UPI000C1CAC4F|nr:AAA family ATPase [Loigolactobacillus backii]PIO82827.1 hypothetical protein BSQ39_04175 [Loigolactobacillus backii]